MKSTEENANEDSKTRMMNRELISARQSEKSENMEREVLFK
jgi:hypothetical protein